MKNFFVRAASGIIVATLVIAAILASRISYGLVVLIAAVGGVYEFYSISAGARHITEADNKKARRTAVAFTVVALALSWVFHFRYHFDDIGIILSVILFIYFVKELYSKSETPFQNIAWNIIPFIYIVLPVMILNYLYFEKGAVFALAILFLIWFYDSMCYICGSLFGKRKLFERISPHKTVEGMVGGMLLSLVFVFFYNKIIALLANNFHNTNWFNVWTYSNLQWLLIGFVTLVAATYGDLVESMLKRSIGVKDSGTFLPGHGGFLDRLDAILVALPFTLAIVFAIDRINDVYLLIDFLG